MIPGVRRVLATSSGKGGVGKSTVSVNLALALQALGRRVGLADVDVFGPTIPLMLGVGEIAQPEVVEGQLRPIERYGLKLMSMGLVTDQDNPAILRGPLVSRFMQQFVLGVAWGELDYLILDLPPGTGDTQISLAQSVPLTGAMVVTTPQDVSLQVARRGIRMFEKVQVPILGVIENMSGYACPQCGHHEPIFLEGGGRRLSEAVGVPFLGEIPIDPAVARGGDAGRPVVLAEPEGRVAMAYAAIARTIDERLARPEAQLPRWQFDWRPAMDPAGPGWRPEAACDGAPAARPIGFRRLNERTLSILWADGVETPLDDLAVRLACLCALCLDERTGEHLLDPAGVRPDVHPDRIRTVGQYALAFRWNDGHDAGIYPFEHLRRLGETPCEAPTSADVPKAADPSGTGPLEVVDTTDHAAGRAPFQ